MLYSTTIKKKDQLSLLNYFGLQCWNISNTNSAYCIKKRVEILILLIQNIIISEIFYIIIVLITN